MNTSGKDNCFNAMWLLARLLKVAVSFDQLRAEIMGHPDYPSILAISDTCKRWKIDNLALRGSAASLMDYPQPFIAEVREANMSYFVAVKAVSGQQVVCSEYTTVGWQTFSLASFLEKWSGVVLLIDAAGCHTVYKSSMAQWRALSQKKIYRLLLFMFLLVILAGTVWASLPQAPLLFPLTQVAGMVVTTLLVLAEIDDALPLVQKVCGKGDGAHCNKVQEAKLFGTIGWNVVGWCFFTGNLCLIAFSGRWQESLGLLQWISLLAIGFVPYSIYYQWQVAKVWCRLCMIVLSVLAIGGITALYIPAVPLAQMIQQMPALLFFYLLCFCLSLAARSAYQQSQEAFQSKVSLDRIKRNENLFQTMLATQPAFVTPPADTMGVTMGRADARYRIVKVCSLHCAPCAASYMDIHRWLAAQYDVQVQIIFITGNDPAAPTGHLLSLARQHVQETFNEQLYDWFAKGRFDVQAFLARHNQIDTVAAVEPEINRMNDWCQANGIQHTPTYFVNGYRLPAVYKLQDLQHFLLT